ncbi:MAG: ribonuclease HII [Nanoarchaeota archaeon]|nr:ribonuclease HII [Nanoarchaeota archaeon]
MLVMGIDDAGRGPVMGPMILAGCLMTEEVEKKLKKEGVKDSKALTQKRREFFEKKIKDSCETFEVEIAYPKDIDGSNESGTKLNELEAQMVAKIINKINKGYGKIKVIIDCPSVSISKWTDYLRMRIKNLSNLELVVKHKADRDHPVVSSASVIAKCTREREMDKLREEFGEEIGSGYPSDPLTMRYLEQNAMKQKDSGLFRRTWITWKQAYDKLKQEKLF